MTDETKTQIGEVSIAQFLKDLKSDAAIKNVAKLLIFTLPFKPSADFPDYYSPDKSSIPILGIEDKEGKVYAFFLTKELINSLAVSCVNIQCVQVHNVNDEPKLIIEGNGKQ